MPMLATIVQLKEVKEQHSETFGNHAVFMMLNATSIIVYI